MSEDQGLERLRTELNQLRRKTNLIREKIKKERGTANDEAIKKYEKELNDVMTSERNILNEIKDKRGDITARTIPNKIIEGAGLFSKEANSFGRLSFPLQSVKHSIEVMNNVACVKTTQNFVNSGDKPVEMIYRYPLLFSSTPHRICVTLNDPETKKKWKFEAKCEEKVKAAEVYDDSISEGKTAVLMTKGDDDHISMNLGNIRPKFEIQVDSIILQEMSMEMVEAEGSEEEELLRMKITIPSIHNKKDDGEHQRQQNNIPQKIQTVEGSMNQLMGKVKSISSPSHPQEDTFEFTINEDENKIDFRTNSPLGLEKEVTFHIELTSPQFMTAQVEKNEEMKESTISVSINPILDDSFLKKSGDEDAGIPMEHIILLDRSGSMMSGNRMKFAIQALQLFIKSLDVDAEPLVNVIGFGSRMEKLYETSKVLDEDSFPHILKNITEAKPNLGGTNMTNPFQYIINELKEPDGFCRVVYLLTDGEADRPSSVTELVKANCKKFQVYSFGIGRGINQSFLTNLSRMTKGRAVFLEQDDQIRPLVIEQLKFASQGGKCLFNPRVSLSGPPMEVEWTKPFPKVLFPRQRINMYGWIKHREEEEEGEGGEGEKQVILKFSYRKGSDKFEEIRTPLIHTKKISTGDDKSFPNNPLGIYAGMNFVEHLDQENTKKRSEEIEKKILELSLKYHFLSSQTSFVGVKTSVEEEEQPITDEMETVEVSTVPYVPGVVDVEYNVRQMTVEEVERRKVEQIMMERRRREEEEKRRRCEEERKRKCYESERKSRSRKRMMMEVEMKRKEEEERRRRYEEERRRREVEERRSLETGRQRDEVRLRKLRMEEEQQRRKKVMVQQQQQEKKSEILSARKRMTQPKYFDSGDYFLKGSSGNTVHRQKKQQQQQPPEKKVNVAISLSEDEVFMNIVNKQQFFGNWEEEILQDLKILDPAKEEFEKLKQTGGDEEFGYWITAIIISILKIKLMEKESEWGLIAKKSRKYLEKKKKSDWIHKAEEFVKTLSVHGLK